MAAESVAHDEAVKSGKRGVTVALVMVVVVFGLLAAAYVFLGGSDVLSGIFGTGEAAQTGTPVTPAKQSSSTTSTPSAETTDPANMPSADQAESIYWEQVASQEQIGKLVTGEITAISFGSVTEATGTADVRIGVSYKSGSTISGTMRLRKYGTAWYFSSIAREGGSLAPESGADADQAVVDTLVSQQASNQEIVAGIVSGAYKKCTVDAVSEGSGTVTLKITVGGGSAPETTGSIVCVSKVIGGETRWFVTSFSKG